MQKPWCNPILPWQKQEYLYRGPNHAANLNNMRLKDKYCDVTIKVNGREIRAHKVVLAANLKYFETMFSSDSFQESQDGVITMKSVRKADLELFVSYAYTGEILLTEDNALNLLELANYLSEDDIKEACVEFLKEHLKAEEACRTYKFANIIECLPLKNAAKAKIITTFGNCSKSPDYLNLDAESLMDILTYGKAQSVQLQKMFFEGILRWIVHDVKSRKIHMEDLLSSIDITKLKADDVMSCLYKNVTSRNDEYGITRDAVVYYEVSKIERKQREQALLIIGTADSKTYFHFYDLTEKKWTTRQEIPNSAGKIHPSSAILNGQLLYYINENSGGIILQMFCPLLSTVTTVHYCSPLLTLATLCACSRFIYVCGGMKKDNTRSDQILRIDPLTDSLDTLKMSCGRSSPAAIFYQDCLFVLGGHGGSYVRKSVEKYDPVRNKWSAVASMCKQRCGHAVAELNGKLYACGGYYGTGVESSVEVYDPATNRWQLVASMNKPRDFPHVIAHEGRLLAIGGDEENTVEVYDPSEDQWQMDHEMSSGLQLDCHVGGLVPATCVTDAR